MIRITQQIHNFFIERIFSCFFVLKTKYSKQQITKLLVEINKQLNIEEKGDALFWNNY